MEVREGRRLGREGRVGREVREGRRLVKEGD